MVEPPSNCPNCATPTEGRYCPECGQDNHRKRLDANRITVDLVQNFFGWDTALGQTLRGLLTGPGRMVAEYVSGRRRRFVNPARFCLLTLALWFLMTGIVGVDPLDVSGIKMSASSGGRAAVIMDRIRLFIGRNLQVLLFLALPMRAWLLRMCFRKSGRNVAECLVLVLYIAGFGYIAGMLLTPFYSKDHDWIVALRPVIAAIWGYWAALAFFGYGWFSTLWRLVVVGILHTIGTFLLFGAIVLIWYLYMDAMAWVRFLGPS